MSTTQPFEHVAPVTGAQKLLAVPPSFFAISVGLAGLAGVWRLASVFYGIPIWIADVLYVCTAVIYIVLLGVLVYRFVQVPRTVLGEITNPVSGLFFALVPISGILLTFGLEYYARGIAEFLLLFFLVVTVLYGGWITGQWIVERIDIDTIHPGYFLPTVAGSLVAADGAGHFGLQGLGWFCFGIGIICWLVLGSIILVRLFTRPMLPPALIPTLAIEVVPPAVAGNAYYTLTGGRIDILTYILAGYTVLMVLVQLRLTSLYRTLAFGPGFWSFTFSYVAVTSYAMRWMHFGRLEAGWALGLSIVAMLAITLFIGVIVWHSLVDLRKGRFIPVVAT